MLECVFLENYVKNNLFEYRRGEREKGGCEDQFIRGYQVFSVFKCRRLNFIMVIFCFRSILVATFFFWIVCVSFDDCGYKSSIVDCGKVRMVSYFQVSSFIVLSILVLSSLFIRWGSVFWRVIIVFFFFFKILRIRELFLDLGQGKVFNYMFLWNKYLISIKKMVLSGWRLGCFNIYRIFF